MHITTFNQRIMFVFKAINLREPLRHVLNLILHILRGLACTRVFMSYLMGHSEMLIVLQSS
jgi:hypothetical protein